MGAAFAVAIALAGSPVAGLYCDDANPAAMACCRDKASECNQPGKTEDCCRVSPAGQETPALVAKAPDARNTAHAAVLSFVETPTLQRVVPHLQIGPLPARAADLSPPRSPILRI